MLNEEGAPGVRSEQGEGPLLSLVPAKRNIAWCWRAWLGLRHPESRGAASLPICSAQHPAQAQGRPSTAKRTGVVAFAGTATALPLSDALLCKASGIAGV